MKKEKIKQLLKEVEKLRRIDGNSDNNFNVHLIAVQTKLQELKTEIAESGHIVHTHLIVFDKKNNINFETQNTKSHKEQNATK